MVRPIKAGHHLKPYDPKDALVERFKFLRSKYFWALVMSYLTLIALVLFYLSRQPIYESSMALVLPGTGSSSNFNLDEVGQASSQTKSAYGSSGFSPRVNYKEIIRSREVVNRASSVIGIDERDFKTPKVKLIQQTSILEVKVLGETADYAQAKSAALYQAFQDRLTELRQDETQRHFDSVSEVLDNYRSRLTLARSAIIEFQERSLLVSRDQWEMMTTQLTEVQEKQMYLSAESRSKEDFVRQLSDNLNISASLAGQAFVLQSDALFQSYMRELDESGKQLSEYRSRWGERHPKVQAEVNRFNKSKALLRNRSIELVGQQSAEALYQMSLHVSPERARLFADLVERYADLQGKKAELKDLKLAEHKLDSTLKIFSREMIELERLEREAQLAEAVYTSAAAKLDASKSDVFASYPVVQMLSPPTNPRKAKSPSPLIAMAVFIGGFIFITLGFLVIWQREFILKKLLNK